MGRLESGIPGIQSPHHFMHGEYWRRQALGFSEEGDLQRNVEAAPVAHTQHDAMIFIY
jgi:hypothetical protein